MECLWDKDRIGFGSYSNIYRNGQYAMKVYRTYNSVGVPGDAIREISVYKRLRHPNIAEVHTYRAGVYVSMPEEVRPERSMSNVWMMMPMASGNLRSVVMNIRNQPPEMMFGIVTDMFRGLAFAHAQGIVHRDIKPENILIYVDAQQTPRARLADFGSCSVHRTFNRNAVRDATEHDCEGRHVGLPGMRTDWVTTLPYRAPEALLGATAALGQAMDVWSMALVMYEMLTRRAFVSMSHREEETALDNIFFNLGTPTPSNGLMPSAFACGRTHDFPRIFSTAYKPGAVWNATYVSQMRGTREDAPIWGMPGRRVAEIVAGTIVLEPSRRLTAQEVLDAMVSAVPQCDASLATDMGGTVLSPSVPQPEMVDGEVVLACREMRMSMGRWIFQACVRPLNFQTRRNFHTAAAIWDQLLCRTDRFLDITGRGMSVLAVNVVAVTCLASKLCDSDPMTAGDYHTIRDRCVLHRPREKWFGFEDDKIAQEDVDAAEIAILNHIDWDCLVTCPVDIESPFCSILDPETRPVFRYLVDSMVAHGSGIHISSRTQKLVSAAHRLCQMITRRGPADMRIMSALVGETGAHEFVEIGLRFLCHMPDQWSPLDEFHYVHSDATIDVPMMRRNAADLLEALSYVQ